MIQDSIIKKVTSLALKKIIIPAIIAKTQEEFESRILKVHNFVEIIQLDFMDDNFVPNSSIDFDFKPPKTPCQLEAHLMIEHPMNWIFQHCDKVDTILVHLESTKRPDKIINVVKRKDKKIGFVLNPETPVRRVVEYLDQIDQVLIMTVKPGFYGSPFLPTMLDKIEELRSLKPDLDIEVDGGITDATIDLVDKAGANMFVSGSYIVKSADVEGAIHTLKSKLSN